MEKSFFLLRSLFFPMFVIYSSFCPLGSRPRLEKNRYTYIILFPKLGKVFNFSLAEDLLRLEVVPGLLVPESFPEEKEVVVIAIEARRTGPIR